MSEPTNTTSDDVLRRIAIEVARREAAPWLGPEAAKTSTPAGPFVRSVAAQAPAFRTNAAREYALADFTSLYGADFVAACYAGLLGRPADAAGLAHYRAFLDRGVAKADIVGRIRRSPEGRQHGARVHGLWPAWAWHSVARIPAVGYLLHLVVDIATLPLLKRRLRRFEDAAFVSSQQGARETASLARRIEALEDAR